MGHLDDAGERLRRSGMRRHQLGAVKDPDEAILDEGLDVVAYESMRHTVSVAADERDRASPNGRQRLRGTAKTKARSRARIRAP